MGHYKGTKCEYSSITFDSLAERDYYKYLLTQDIKGLEVHKKIELIPSFKYYGKTIRNMSISPDFVYYRSGLLYIEDVKPIKKSLIDKDFLVRWKLLQYIKRDDNIIFNLVAWDKNKNKFVNI